MQKKIIIGSTVGAVVFITLIVWAVNAFSNKQMIQISGVLEADTVQVPSLVSGVVDEIKAEDGTEVKKGDVILKVDTSQLKIRQEQANAVVKQAEAQLEMVKNGASKTEISQMQAKVNQARAGLQTVASGARPEEIIQAKSKLETAQVAYDQAEKKYESSKKLYDQDIIPKNQLETAELAYNNAKSNLTTAQESLKLLQKGAPSGQINLAQQRVVEANAAYKQLLDGPRPEQIKAAEAQLEQAKSELKLIKKMINDSAIKAPIDGTVSDVALNQGELVTKGSSVAGITDLDNLWVKVFVPESKIAFVKSDQKATIIPEALSNTSFPGRVAYIAQEGSFVPAGTKESMDQQVFEIKVKLDNASLNNMRLRPGMTVKVQIDTSLQSEKKKKSKDT